MNWQDMVFSTGGGFFCLALLPILVSKEARLPRSTSVPTAVFIGLFAVTHYSLGLYWATFTEACSAGCWAFIAWKRPS